MSVKSKVSSIDSTNQATAKLRRLKIQESVLFSSLLQLFKPLELDLSLYSYSEHKKKDSPLKVGFIQIRNLLEDIKIEVTTQKNLKHLDVSQFKKEVLGLESKLKCFKKQLQEELCALKDNANIIYEQLRANNFIESELKNKTGKQENTQFSEITPSPVRALINSPLKCTEVQKLQEFIANSQKRTGKWNEHNHNIFVKIWNKYYHQNDEVPETIDDIIKRKDFHLFSEEVTKNVSGITYDDITSHLRWYYEYISLKYSQQKALEKWRENKQKIKKSIQQVKRNSNFERDVVKLETSTIKSLHRSNNASIKSKVYDSTQQWRNRCESNKDPPPLFPYTPRKSKVHIPNWRLGLSQHNTDI